MGKSTNKHRKIVLLATSKLSGIEKIISKALIDSCFVQEEFTLSINEKQINLLKKTSEQRTITRVIMNIKNKKKHSKKIVQNDRQSLKLKTDQ